MITTNWDRYCAEIEEYGTNNLYWKVGQHNKVIEAQLFGVSILDKYPDIDEGNFKLQIGNQINRYNLEGTMNAGFRSLFLAKTLGFLTKDKKPTKAFQQIKHITSDFIQIDRYFYVLQQQIEKWFYWNPIYDKYYAKRGEIERVYFDVFSLYPFFFTIKVLSSLPDNSVTHLEFKSFLLVSRHYSECKDVVNRIIDLRQHKDKDALIQKLIKASKKIDDRLTKVFSYSRYISVSPDKTISLKNIIEVEDLIKKFETLLSDGLLIEYNDENPDLYYEMLYSDKRLFDFCSVGSVDFLVNETIKFEDEEKLDKDKENFIEEKTEEVFISTLSLEEKEGKAKEVLKKYKERKPKEKVGITKVLVRKYERGPIGKALKVLYNYTCQVCGFTFIKSDGEGYAETHHLENLADKGLDVAENIIVVCANCQRQFHYANVKKLSRDKEKLVVTINDNKKVIYFKHHNV